MKNIIKDLYYYKKINADDLINDIRNDYYVDLLMCNSNYVLIKNMQENLITLKNGYRIVRFTFSNNLSCTKNKIIDIRIQENGGAK